MYSSNEASSKLLILISVCLSFGVESLPFSPQSAATLKYVAVVSRHGSRSPLITFPNDPYPYTDTKFWPNGPNQITNQGRVEMLEVGRNLRARYKNLLNTQYQPNNLDLQYNPYDRDFTSAAIIGAGLYPPRGPQIWSKSLPWQPVVMSLRKFDVCDLETDNTCPKYMEIFKDQFNKFNSNSAKYTELLNYVSSNTGKTYSNLTDMYYIYDTFLSQQNNKLKLPAWTKKVFPDKLRPLGVHYLVQLYAGTEEQIRLGSGPELKFISDGLMMKANGTFQRDRIMYVEAAHDCTLLVLLRALGNNNPNLEILPGAYLAFELHILPPDYIVQVFYFSQYNDVAPKLIEIDGCPSPCSLNDFVKFVDGINPPNYNDACQV